VCRWVSGPYIIVIYRGLLGSLLGLAEQESHYAAKTGIHLVGLKHSILSYVVPLTFFQVCLYGSGVMYGSLWI
jgi:hypothetical protein